MIHCNNKYRERSEEIAIKLRKANVHRNLSAKIRFSSQKIIFFVGCYC
jgi:hypothetical protein